MLIVQQFHARGAGAGLDRIHLASGIRGSCFGRDFHHSRSVRERHLGHGQQPTRGRLRRGRASRRSGRPDVVPDDMPLVSSCMLDSSESARGGAFNKQSGRPDSQCLAAKKDSDARIREAGMSKRLMSVLVFALVVSTGATLLVYRLVSSQMSTRPSRRPPKSW